MKKNVTINLSKCLAAVLGYYLITGCGFTILRLMGIDYQSEFLYSGALPMMGVLAAYVFFLNTRVFRKYGIKERLYDISIHKNRLLFLLSLTVITMVVCVYIESFISGSFSKEMVIFTVLSLLIGFSEEGMFRGFIITWCRRFTDSRIFLIVVSTALFAFLHMVNISNGMSINDAWSQTVKSVPMGLLAGVIFAYRNTLWPLILWHFSIDFTLFMGRIGDFSSLLIGGYVIDGILIIVTLLLLKDIFADIKNKIKNR